MTTVDVAQMGLDGATVVQVTAMRLLTSAATSRVQVAEMALSGGLPPTGPPPRFVLTEMYLFPASTTEGMESLLVRWDGTGWRHMDVVTWSGSAWVGPS